MGKLTREDILRLAQLARLQLSDDEVEQFTAEISAILGYVDQLQAIDLTGVESTNQVTGLTNVMRADKIIDYNVTPAELLKNAPAIEAGHLKVRRMLS